MKRNIKIRAVPISAITVLNSRERTSARFKELVTSIVNLGLKRPITVSKSDQSGHYQLACGQGRMEAFTTLGQKEIPAILVDASAEECILMSLIENIARRRHSPVELVSEIGRLAMHYSIKEITAKLDLSAEYVTAIVYLLKHAEERLVSAVERGIVPPTLAIEIAKAKSPKLQGALLETYISERHTSKQIAKMRKLVEQRHRNTLRARVGDDQITSGALVRAYRRETDRQKLLARKAEFAEARLAFIVNALKRLLSERMFTTLLREERLETLPLPVLRRMASPLVT
jgi:ParB family transcriptional regulator, chromosome partitioning protein